MTSIGELFKKVEENHKQQRRFGKKFVGRRVVWAALEDLTGRVDKSKQKIAATLVNTLVKSFEEFQRRAKSGLET